MTGMAQYSLSFMKFRPRDIESAPRDNAEPRPRGDGVVARRPDTTKRQSRHFTLIIRFCELELAVAGGTVPFAVSGGWRTGPVRQVTPQGFAAGSTPDDL